MRFLRHASFGGLKIRPIENGFGAFRNGEDSMPEQQFLHDDAVKCAAEARAFQAAGRAEEALGALRRAVLLYAAADTEREIPETPGPLTLSRAEACRNFGAALAAEGRHAEAANVLQEATDLYGLLEAPEAQDLARECAHRVLECVAALKADPKERLHLLVAHYERAQEQLTLEAGSEVRQAEARMHIARIYQRRERPADSVASYREALDLLGRAEGSADIALARAECHHRIATLLADVLADPAEAVRHYRSAIKLYQPYEPIVYGFQQSLELCRAALARTEASMSRRYNGRDREWSRE